MSFQAMAWAVGDELDCGVCGKHIVAEFAYERLGVCGACVRRLGHEYSMAHSGEPLFGFSSDEDFVAHTKTAPSAYRKAKLGQRLRKQVFERDAYRCRLCGSHLDLHVDHIFPESKGGRTELSNLQTLCAPCNTKKGASIP